MPKKVKVVVKKRRKVTAEQALTGAVGTVKKYTYGAVKSSVNKARARRTQAIKKKKAGTYAPKQH